MWQHILSRSSSAATITWAVSAEQALTILRESAVYKLNFDLIIVDLFLAGSETGVSFLNCEEVKKSKAQTILVSAAQKNHLDSFVQNQHLEAKVIAKPLNVVKCEKVLDELKRERATL